MTFERYTDRQRHADGEPQLYVRPDNDFAYLNVHATREFFHRHGSPVGQIVYYTDRETSSLGIAFDDGPNSFSVSHKDSGANISVGGTLRKAFDVEVADLDERWEGRVERSDHPDIDVEIDIGELVELTTDDVHCPECGERYATAGNGLKTHLSQTHDTSPRAILEDLDPDAIGGPTPDGDDSWHEHYDRASQEVSDGT